MKSLLQVAMMERGGLGTTLDWQTTMYTGDHKQCMLSSHQSPWKASYLNHRQKHGLYIIALLTVPVNFSQTKSNRGNLTEYCFSPSFPIHLTIVRVERNDRHELWQRIDTINSNHVYHSPFSSIHIMLLTLHLLTLIDLYIISCQMWHYTLPSDYNVSSS